jgi:hypothetical protein
VSGKKTNPDLSPEQQEQLRQWQKWQAMQKPNPPLEEQQQQLGELWRSEWKQWIPIEGAIALIEKSPIPDMTPGYARKLLNDAIASGAVTVAYANQDRDPYMCRRDDLEGWIARQVSQVSKPAPAKPPRVSKPSRQERRALRSIQAIWSGKVPDDVPNGLLCTQVIEWLKADEGSAWRTIGDSSILRAAGRKKK